MYIYEVIDRSVENKYLRRKLAVAAGAVAKRLHAVDFNQLEISDYTKKYIRGYLDNTHSILQICTYLIYIAIKSRNLLNLKDTVFVDYGGGTGIMSLLAKEVGFGSVLYVDIYDVSCKDAEMIACHVGKGADKYICGGVDELYSYVNNARISVDVIASYDVIEHIYDLDEFYAKLNLLNSKEMCIVCASSANMYNPMIRKKRVAGQQKTEYQSRPHEWGHKERDSLQSYLGLRKEIISNFAPHLPSDIVDLIAKNTRGLYKNDIEKCVREYLEIGDFAYRPSHPTNTCDPMTGNWNERLMSARYIKDTIETHGFEFSFLCGYYGFSRDVMRHCIKAMINKMIGVAGKYGIILSPYYVAIAEKKPAKLS